MVALALLLFRDAVFLGRVFFDRDVHLVWYPQVEAFVRSIFSGSWPLWDPYTGFGQPLLANPSAQVLYPPTWLHLLMRPWTVYTVYVVAHLALSGIGLYLLGRRLEMSRAGAFVAGVVWMASGPLLSLVNVWHHFGGAAWLPWVVLAAERALGSGRRMDALAWGAATAGQVLAGSPDMSILTLVVVAGLVFRSLVWRAPGREGTRSRLVQVALAAGATLALSAAQWLPTFAAATASARFDLNPAKRTAWSVHPLGMIQTLLPMSFVDLAGISERIAESFDLWSPFLASIYLGLPALGLVLAAVARPGRPYRWFFVVLGAGAALYALGRYAPIHGISVAALPLLQLLRYPSKAMIVTAFCWAALSGMGYDALCQGLEARGRSLWTAAMLSVVVVAWAGVLIGLGGAELLRPLLMPLKPGSPLEATLAAIAWKLLLPAGLATIAFLLAVRLAARPRAAAALAFLAVVDLLAAHDRVNPTTRKEFFTQRPGILEVLPKQRPTRIHVWDYVMKVPGREPNWPDRVPLFYEIPKGWPRVAGGAMAMQEYLYPPSAARWGLYGSFDPDLLDLGGRVAYEMNLVVRAAAGTPEYARLLRMAGVDFAVTLHDEGLEDLVRHAALPGLYSQPIRVFQVPDPQPRAYAVGSSRIATGPEAARILRDPAFDPARQVVLSVGPAAQASPAFAAECRIVELTADRVRLDADLSEPGFVILLDGHAPGWVASVDGRDAEVAVANLLFRAVSVPAGRHRIEFAYRPPAAVAGAAVSALAWLLAVAVALRAFWRTAVASIE